MKFNIQNSTFNINFRYGQAVYVARNLVNNLAGYEDRVWFDEEICVYGVNYRRANPNSEADNFDNKNIIVYPNPTKDLLNFKVELIANQKCNTIKSYTITDLQGKEIYTKKYNEAVYKDSIDIKNIADGYYSITFECIDNIKSRFGFIVNHE